MSRMSMKDEDRLAELGYKQELTRNWSLLHNFGVSFSIIVRLHLLFVQTRIRIGQASLVYVVVSAFHLARCEYCADNEPETVLGLA